MKNRSYASYLLGLTTLLFILAAPLSNAWAAENTAFSQLQSVNINTADAEQIAAGLNGIGLKKARTIVEWRKQHGPFTDVNELLKIKGVGQKTLSKNSDRITLE